MGIATDGAAIPSLSSSFEFRSQPVVGTSGRSLTAEREGAPVPSPSPSGEFRSQAVTGTSGRSSAMEEEKTPLKEKKTADSQRASPKARGNGGSPETVRKRCGCGPDLGGLCSAL